METTEDPEAVITAYAAGVGHLLASHSVPGSELTAQHLSERHTLTDEVAHVVIEIMKFNGLLVVAGGRTVVTKFTAEDLAKLLDLLERLPLPLESPFVTIRRPTVWLMLNEPDTLHGFRQAASQCGDQHETLLLQILMDKIELAVIQLKRQG